eukprot:1942110-Rhodomonas_salina.3
MVELNFLLKHIKSSRPTPQTAHTRVFCARHVDQQTRNSCGTACLLEEGRVSLTHLVQQFWPDGLQREGGGGSKNTPWGALCSSISYCTWLGGGCLRCISLVSFLRIHTPYNYAGILRVRNDIVQKEVRSDQIRYYEGYRKTFHIVLKNSTKSVRRFCTGPQPLSAKLRWYPVESET